MPITTVVADADGTLIDTLMLIRSGQFAAVRQGMAAHGVPAEFLPSGDDFLAAFDTSVGGSYQDTLRQIVVQLLVGHPEYIRQMDWDELASLLDPIQDRMAQTLINPMPGLYHFLHAVGDHGRDFAVMSSGSTHQVVRNFGFALPELGIQQLYLWDAPDAEKLNMLTGLMTTEFGLPGFTIVTSDNVEHRKPHPEGVYLAMARLGATPGETAMLGDDVVDAQAALAAGLPVRIGITHGFRSRQVLQDAPTTHVVDGLWEVLPLLR